MNVVLCNIEDKHQMALNELKTGDQNLDINENSSVMENTNQETTDKQIIKTKKKISTNDTLRQKFLRNSNFLRLR